ncbi:GNAT family N-acetyltransferase [Pseudovibrio exalbescens]|uniref:GNAT family N-acetyltransferase n=1 Tax=Pseudovibrio exalbescens TaxID=197461 RepID=UPI0023668D26|nr:GNAT family N-acetyltransferase [Pseudovibrio exalbescens]MDD7909829.1 GNAT family N-acetyltransferase [Pseudovibrio exalbescens]
MTKELVTQRLRLRAPSMDDAPAFAKYLKNFEVSGNLARVPHPYTLEDAQLWLSLKKPEDSFAWCLERDGEAIGCVIIRNLGDRPTIGYWLAQPFWGKGFMSEAVHAVLTHAFEDLGVYSFNAGAYTFNKGSIGTLTKQGFVYGGRGFQSCAARGGEEMPEYRYYLTKAAFMAKKKQLEPA